MTIRSAADNDFLAIFDVQQNISLPDSPTVMPWAAQPGGPKDDEAGLWVILQKSKIIGYSSIMATPGLPGAFDMILAIDPPVRQQGFGGQLLEFTCAAARQLGAQQLSWPVYDTETESSRFLLRRGFRVGHVEQLLKRDLTAALPPVPEMPDATFRTLPRAKTIELFTRLYDESFAGLTWAQPYSAEELAEQLGNSNDLFYAYDGREAVGFAWLQGGSSGIISIEPFGIRPPYQGRGYGRKLLIAALHKAKARGADEVRIGTWIENEIALNLYRKHGFVDRRRITYLTRHLSVKGD